MRILWLINIPLKEASKLLGEEPIPYGGWLENSSINLSKQNGIELFVAFPSHKVNRFIKLKGERMIYYPFRPLKDQYNIYLEQILHEAKPDLVHICGTEMQHSLTMVNLCNQLRIKAVVSIQGLTSIIEKHMYSGLPFHAVYGLTIRNMIRNDNVRGLRKTFIDKGKYEIEAMQQTRYIIGRTTWDKACALQINPGCQYFHCNETLREEFYKKEWKLDQCEKYSIFVSQAQYSIKGLHFVLEALPIILKKFPMTKVYISGKNIIRSSTIKDKLVMTYYGKYIISLMKKYHLENSVIFTGPLDEKKMCERFLKTHVFVSSSTIENESNSLSEAKMLGVPSVASYVGGVIDRINHEVDGYFYQHDAPYMLAHYISEIFRNEDKARDISKEARKQALVIHDKDTNTKKLMDIYSTILES